ncbi:hypothetical protein [Hymenobacter roseosalivarius]|uniref:hypothetical protein n=1 Tax=Hymenobacter roseosalivarius TaxID=89967 RepID=UPI000A0406F0|nr:hypothetical protein [Hymenobacter roseosalivarius]
MRIQDVKVGDFIELDGLLGVVVGIIPNEHGNLEDHLVIWFGAESQKRISQGGAGNPIPEVWTVPAEYCKPAQPPVFRH